MFVNEKSWRYKDGDGRLKVGLIDRRLYSCIRKGESWSAEIFFARPTSDEVLMRLKGMEGSVRLFALWSDENYFVWRERDNDTLVNIVTLY